MRIIALVLLMTSAASALDDDFVKFQTARNYFRAGIEYYDAMEYLASVEYFRKAIETYPEYETARDYLSRAYALAGFRDLAVQELESLLYIAPDNVRVASRLDSLRYQYAVQDASRYYSRYIYHNSYVSATMGRYSFAGAMDIVADRFKNVYVSSFEKGRIVTFNVNGEGEGVIKPAASGRLYGLDLMEDTLLASHFSSDRVFLMDRKGSIVTEFGGSGSSEGFFHGPEGVLMVSKDEIYVVDNGNHRVQRFNGQGNFILSFGRKGRYEGELNNPTDITILDDRLYVTDTGNGRLAVYDRHGNFIENHIIEGMREPRGIRAQDDRLVIADFKKGVCFYNPSSGMVEWLEKWKTDDGDDSFRGVTSTAQDRDGYLYATDARAGAVRIFSPLQRTFSNLDLTIYSVDSSQFPVVAFYLQVRNRDGSPVYGLRAENFRVQEDTAPITNFSTDYLKRMRPSSSMIFLVDRSRKMEGYHNEIPWLYDFVLKKMHQKDRVKVINFHDDQWDGADWDWSRRRTVEVLKKRDYRDSQDLGRAFYYAITETLERLDRRAVILVTEGSLREDSFQEYTPDTIVQYARAHYVPLYIISINPPDQQLQRIARDTGGMILRPRQLDDLRGLYDRIEKSEEYRYVLVYSTFKPAVFSGWWSNVKIEVQQKGQKGVRWGGYFIP